MRVLIIKTSSMGDVIHTLPALTDAGRVLSDIHFDWVVEENFSEIPKWHPLVDRVIPVAWRRWRKNIFSKKTYQEWKHFKYQLQSTDYDFVIDAQGLLKSAILTRLIKGIRCGLNWHSARESFASLFYHRQFFVEKKQHAITRIRNLFSQIFAYDLPTTIPVYGIKIPSSLQQKKYIVFLHGTTWKTKEWPENYWIELGKLVNQSGFLIKLPWGNQIEYERAERIAKNCQEVEVLPPLNLLEIKNVLASAQAIVAMDTGLGHLAAALSVPMISLYGPTHPDLTGALGKSQIHLKAQFSCAPCFNRTCRYQENSPLYPPCFTTLPPELVWKFLSDIVCSKAPTFLNSG